VESASGSETLLLWGCWVEQWPWGGDNCPFDRSRRTPASTPIGGLPVTLFGFPVLPRTMSSEPHSTSVSPALGSLAQGGAELQTAFAQVASDRAATGVEIVRESAGVLLDWLALQHHEASPTGDTKQARADRARAWDALAESLDWGLSEVRDAQGWRGAVAGWLHTIDQLTESGRRGEDIAPRSPASAQEILAEEMGLWLGGAGAGEARWNGEPLANGRRLADRSQCADHLLSDLERGEVICVHGYSDTVALALEAAGQRGLAPEVLVSEGGPDLGGRRLARRLNKAGLHVRYVYDSALAAWAQSADRVWLGTEAIGAEAFLGLVGCANLCEQARQQGVPVTVLATGDKLLPAGWSLATPAWGEDSTWQLWGDAPEGVRVESQPYELVSADLPSLFVSEYGQSTAADYSVRFLRTAEGTRPSSSPPQSSTL